MHGRILIVDGTVSNRIICRARLANAFYKPILADSGIAALLTASTERPQLILVALDLGDMPALELIPLLRQQAQGRAVPLIALIPEGIAPELAPALRVAALRAGADAVLARPIAEGELLARIRSLMRREEGADLMASAWGREAPEILAPLLSSALQAPPSLAPSLPPPGTTRSDRIALPSPFGASAGQAPNRIALVGRPNGRLAQWERALRGRLRDRLQLMTPIEALSIPLTRPLNEDAPETPEVFVIEADLGTDRDSGARLMAQLSTHPACRHSAFCIVTAPGDAAGKAMALDLGADDALASDHTAEEIVLRLRAILRHKRRADRIRSTVEDGLRLAMIDPLTGCYNRRYALPRLTGIADQAASANGAFAVMVADLDRFKAVNDQLGHAAGDTVLAEVARRLSDNLRMADLLARIGGEEFLIALPQTGAEEAALVAERLRRVISATPIRLADGSDITVTISIGVAIGGTTIAPDHAAPEVAALIEQADQALRGSKQAGRNLVTLRQSAA